MKKSLVSSSLVSILWGLFTIVLIGIIVHFGLVYVNDRLIAPSPSGEFQSSQPRQPYLTFLYMFKSISLISPLLGGVVVGFLVKRKGWQYGLLLGMILVIISLGFVITISTLRNDIFGSKIPQIIIEKQVNDIYSTSLRKIPLILVLSLIGGIVGENIVMKRNKNEGTKKTQLF